ncbi:putative RNA-directed DNA polymerase like protein [Argiope bruennichi]|uniref:Putative RNA-directed DNA polymerase like protein n=1 Tax=Argiope bruennichi TaxID=94029 RepID=A0A8T0FH88_ARGBR|nr:putative RNA-directed DNA polymerase like protein [Argiope bruennichi]
MPSSTKLKKEELRIIAEELGLSVPDNVKVIQLREIIEKSEVFKTQTGVVQGLVDQNTVFGYVGSGSVNEVKENKVHFVKTHKRNEEGRYVLTMPLKQDPSCLGHSKDIAVKRLNSLWNHLSKDSDYLSIYLDFMRGYEVLGHMKKVYETTASSSSYYLVHHGIFRQEKSTTKFRVDFNASPLTTNANGSRLGSSRCEHSIIDENTSSQTIIDKIRKIINEKTESRFYLKAGKREKANKLLDHLSSTINNLETYNLKLPPTTEEKSQQTEDRKALTPIPSPSKQTPTVASYADITKGKKHPKTVLLYPTKTEGETDIVSLLKKEVDTNASFKITNVRKLQNNGVAIDCNTEEDRTYLLSVINHKQTLQEKIRPIQVEKKLPRLITYGYHTDVKKEAIEEGLKKNFDHHYPSSTDTTERKEKEATGGQLQIAAGILEEIFPHPVSTPKQATSVNYSPDDCPFSPQEVARTINGLPKGKAPGLDGIDNIVIQQINQKFPQLFTDFFNKCLTLKKFPDSLKIGNIILFRKPGKPINEATSYRPISLLPTIGKVLEKLLTQRLTYHLEKNNHICNRQYGFREGKSILTATPITSEKPISPLHDKTSTTARKTPTTNAAHPQAQTTPFPSCIAHDIPAPTQPKTNHSCSNPAKSAPHQPNRIQLAYSNPLQPKNL